MDSGEIIESLINRSQRYLLDGYLILKWSNRRKKKKKKKVWIKFMTRVITIPQLNNHLVGKWEL